MKPQTKILDSYEQGGILTINLEAPSGKVGKLVGLEFDKAFITGRVIKKIGNQLKIRISTITKKEN